ncbi:hypothetical protein FN846DRAFT_959485 [Sphaerosporella brunnea]|uniref:Uncharacterized protein n=1 Tax=Sphaerosporella brunnea TaxID=1250544 RepID=A0A5J5ER16_9PEZI|nr:hypothetical protein FN846DRAFT_959485 [Sphaerosporella brunnea]
MMRSRFKLLSMYLSRCAQASDGAWEAGRTHVSRLAKPISERRPVYDMLGLITGKLKLLRLRVLRFGFSSSWTGRATAPTRRILYRWISKGFGGSNVFRSRKHGNSN